MTSASVPFRRRLIQAGLGLAAGLALPAARAAIDCKFFGRNLAVHHPWTRATAPGDRFAMLFLEIDEVTVADRLVDVRAPFATGADMAGTRVAPAVDLALPVGMTTVLSEQGGFVRLLGLEFALHVGREYPIDLVFETAGTVAASVSVDYERGA